MQAKSTDDEALLAALRQVRDGHIQAYGRVVEVLQRPLFRVLMRYLHNAEDAMDLVQQSLLRAFEELPKLQRVEAFRPWLFRIATNLALSSLRQASRHAQDELDAERHASPSPNAEQTLSQAQEREALYAALDVLSPSQRAIVVLRLETELGYAEIAESVGSTENAARVHFHNAVRRLRDELRDRGVSA